MQHYGCMYGLGAKAPSLDCDTSEIRMIDCSGFVRYAIAKATNQRLILPDGSVSQHHWCDANALHGLRYSSIAPNYGNQGKLYIAFINPEPVGHVWLVHQGHTLESHGSAGPSSRPWNTPILAHGVSVCYELPVKG